uniref:ATP synthase subunit g, mitochondrial n=1 Tax=Globodera rostochiensis TaxID=31243 RepID=A0A914IC97_GLORO
MSTRKLNLLEKIANMLGVIYRYHEPNFPRYKDMLKKMWFRELAPPTPKDWPQIKADFSKLDNLMKMQSYKALKLKEFLAYSAVFVEVICWFFVGEIIGRGSLTGYIIRSSYIDPTAAKKMAKFKWDDHSELEIKHDEVHGH